MPVGDALIAWSEPLSKAVTYGALLVVLGVVGARWVCARAWPRHVCLDDVRDRLDRIALVGACVLLASLVVRAWAHTATAFGLEDSAVWANLRLVALESRWGAAWRLQMLAAFVMVGTALAADLWHRGAWRGLATLAALYTAAMLTGSGHAASSLWWRTLHTAHLVAAGAWAGTLGALAVSTRHRPVAERLRAFRGVAPVATAAVSVVVATGLAMAVRYLGGFEALSSDYAARLGVKIVLVLLMLGLGAVNWRRLRSAQDARWLRTIDGEVVLAALVVIATAVLSETAHP